MTPEEIIRQVYALLGSNEKTKNYIIVNPDEISKSIIGAPIPKPH